MKPKVALKSQIHLRAASPLVLLLFLSLSAWGRFYHIAKFNANVHIDRNGSARVTEQISFAFSGEYKGVHRSIPVEYPGPNGTNYSLFITVNSVTDDGGSKLKFEKHTTNGY